MDAVQQRFRAALELRDLMIAMRRQVLVREYPGESEAEIDARLRAWVLHAGPPTLRRDDAARSG